MLWRILSYNAFALNTENYFAFLRSGDNPSILPTVTPGIIKRGSLPPVISDLTRELDQLAVTVVVGKNDPNTLVKNLIGAFDNQDESLHSLIIEEDVSGVQWSVQAKPANVLREKGLTYKVLFDIPDRIWRKTATPIVWTVTSSPATQNVTNAGNKKTYPKFTYKPTAMKSNGFLYRYWVPITNPSLTLAFQNWGLELGNGALNTTGWVKDASNYVQINNVGGITNSQTTIPYDTLTGSVPSYGMGYIDDGVNKEQIYWTGRTGTTSGNLTGVTRHIGGTSAYAFADNVKIYLSYMQANGADLRLYVDGIDQDIWVRSPNTAATKVWCVASQNPGIQMTLATSVAGAGAVTQLEFQNSVANNAALTALPASGVIVLDDEAFSYWSKDLVKRIVYVEARNINDTVAAAHSVGAVAYYIEHDAWLYSGNPILTARENDESRKPILDMDNSNNSTRTYAEFWDLTGLRANSFKHAVLASSFPDDLASRTYSGDHTDESADPATEMGMRMMSIYKSGRWQFENGKIACGIYEPAGIASVTTWTYEKYRLGLSWPATAALQKSKDGTYWFPVTTVATPASAGSWGSPATVGPFTLGSGYFHLQTYFAGTITGGNSAGVGYEADLETNALTYVTAAPLVPRIMARGSNSYQAEPKFTNTTNGQYFRIQRTMALNEQLEIDCGLKTVTTIADGIRRRSALIVPEDQVAWMEFVSGVNALEYEETGVTGVEITIAYDDMLAV